MNSPHELKLACIYCADAILHPEGECKCLARANSVQYEDDESSSDSESSDPLVERPCSVRIQIISAQATAANRYTAIVRGITTGHPVQKAQCSLCETRRVFCTPVPWASVPGFAPESVNAQLPCSMHYSQTIHGAVYGSAFNFDQCAWFCAPCLKPFKHVVNIKFIRKNVWTIESPAMKCFTRHCRQTIYRTQSKVATKDYRYCSDCNAQRFKSLVTSATELPVDMLSIIESYI